MSDVAKCLPDNCPCVVSERPEPPCTYETCFHSGHGDSCAHCDVDETGGRVGNLMKENARLKKDNSRLRRIIRDVVPRLNKILAESDP